MFCREHAAQLRDAAEVIQAAGGRIAAVGCGKPEQAAVLREKLALPYPVYADPERHSFRAVGMRRSPLLFLDPRQVTHLWRAWRAGARNSAMQGDPWQLGGMLVVAPGNRVLFEHRSRHPGDHASLDALLGAVRAGAQAPSPQAWRE